MNKNTESKEENQVKITDCSGRVEPVVSCPILDTLWQRCFWEVHESCVAKGLNEVNFLDVDALVLEKSKGSLIDLKNWLSN